MNYVLDIVAILFVLCLTIYGLTAGFYKSVVNVLLTIVCFAGAAALAVLIVLKLYDKIGWLKDLTLMMEKTLGTSKVQNGQKIVDTAAYGIAFALLQVPTFLILLFILNLLRTALLKLVQKIRKVGFFKFFGNFLGMIVGFAISVGLIFGFMATVRTFRDSDTLFRATNETLQATEVLSVFYDKNPLNDILDGTGIAKTVEESIEKIKNL